jgi:hypothetical protein
MSFELPPCPEQGVLDYTSHFAYGTHAAYAAAAEALILLINSICI